MTKLILPLGVDSVDEPVPGTLTLPPGIQDAVDLLLAAIERRCLMVMHRRTNDGVGQESWQLNVLMKDQSVRTLALLVEQPQAETDEPISAQAPAAVD